MSLTQTHPVCFQMVRTISSSYNPTARVRQRQSLPRLQGPWHPLRQHMPVIPRFCLPRDPLLTFEDLGVYGWWDRTQSMIEPSSCIWARLSGPHLWPCCPL